MAWYKVQFAKRNCVYPNPNVAIRRNNRIPGLFEVPWQVSVVIEKESFSLTTRLSNAVDFAFLSAHQESESKKGVLKYKGAVKQVTIYRAVGHAYRSGHSIPLYSSMNRLGVFPPPPTTTTTTPDGMLVYLRGTRAATTSKFAGIHLYSSVKRGTLRVK